MNLGYLATTGYEKQARPITPANAKLHARVAGFSVIEWFATYHAVNFSTR